MNEKYKEKRKQRTIEEKYEIIQFYESIENRGRGEKISTRKKFEISTVSSLLFSGISGISVNVILSHRDEIIRIYELNQLATSRVRLTSSRLPTLDKIFYESVTFLRGKTSKSPVTKATEIKTFIR